ncbi:hypothetical protein [Bradyrhizobium sp.]|uniref:hypothetical protein n=1 Tax=Bradyrhizobium sp. TaxID=376 RepID=UPI0025BCC8EA|nr:hypothetical protein [Bradyrhizobium sp.]
MKRLMIAAITVITLLAAATSMLQSQSPLARRSAGTSAHQLRATTDVNKLPIEEFDDQSLVYSKMRR